MSAPATVPSPSVAGSLPDGLRRPPTASVASALAWYRLVAYVVGVGLVVLVCIGVPLKYLASTTAVVAVVGPLHGFLYVVYLLLVANLSLKARWNPIKTVLVMLAGTVPFLSFVAERKVTADERALS